MHIKVEFNTLKQLSKPPGSNGEYQKTELYLRGLMCRIFQHEIDHLDGHVIWDENASEIQ